MDSCSLVLQDLTGLSQPLLQPLDFQIRFGWRDPGSSCNFVLVDDGIDVERGVRLLEKAVEEEPENPHFLDSLGWAYFKTGRLREAYDLIEHSLEIDDSGPSGEARRAHLEEVGRALE